VAVGLHVFIGQPGATVPGVAAFWALFAAWVLGESWLQWRRRLPAGATGRDRGSMRLLIGSVWLAVVVAIGVSAQVRAAAIPAGPARWLFASGLALMASGLALRWYAIAVLGAAFTVMVGTHAEQRLVESGPYRWVRHPSYTGGLLTVLGILLCCTNLLSLPMLLLPIAGYAYRMRVEEEALLESHGDAYRAYMHRTRRLVPLLY
jgi:protein-S-isoprenylcysteine O-methyltransferase